MTGAGAGCVAPRLSLLPRFGSGDLTLLKLLGLALMVVDHVDAFVFARSLSWAGGLGRLVFPIFAVVFGYNLARPWIDAAARSRILRRLVGYGLLALPFHAALSTRGELNIMFTFAAAVVVLQLRDLGWRRLATLAFVVSGFVVEYNWPGVGLLLSVVAYYRRPGAWAASAVLLFWVALVLPNGSLLALWALPVIWLASRLNVDLPRLRTLFYAFYPAHLAAFWVLVRVV